MLILGSGEPAISTGVPVGGKAMVYYLDRPCYMYLSAPQQLLFAEQQNKILLTKSERLNAASYSMELLNGFYMCRLTAK